MLSGIEGILYLVNNEKILIITLNKEVLAPLVRLLCSESYQAISATSPAEGLEIISREEIALAVIDTDATMPELEVLETLRRLREFRPRMPVIILANYASKETAKKAFLTGAFDFIIKPPENAYLLNTIKKALTLIRV